jgi:hypothetical protein
VMTARCPGRPATSLARGEVVGGAVVAPGIVVVVVVAPGLRVVVVLDVVVGGPACGRR